MRYILSGIFFGFVLVKSEVISWFRIQEMFHFDAFYMYGIIGSAIIVAGISIQLIKHWNIRDVLGDRITLKDKDTSQYKRYIIGGIIFGIGWAFTGACPGPMYALTGTGLLIFIVPLLSAVAGTWFYGRFRKILPH